MLLALLPAAAQPAEPVRRIGWLSQGVPQPVLMEAFHQGLRDMGYREGQNLRIELRHAEGQFAPLPGLAAELVQLPVEMLVTSGIAATRAAQTATSTLPIVFAFVPDPVEHGVIARRDRPGGTITGVANAGQEFLVGKLLEILRTVVPTATRVAVLGNPDHPLYARGVEVFQTAARVLQLAPHVIAVREPATELERAFAAMAQERVEALVLSGDPVFSAHRDRIIALAAASRLPAMMPDSRYVREGGLMAYYPEPRAIQRRAGVMAGQILRGARPADIPTEFPTTFSLSINLKTAQALGLTMPPDLLVLADEVIQ